MNVLTNIQIKQYCFLLIIIFLSFLISKELILFLPSFLGAITLYVFTKKIYLKLLSFNINPSLASILMIIICLFILFTPFYLFINLVYNKVGDLTKYSKIINQSLTFISVYLMENFQIDILSEDHLKALNSFLLKNIQSIVNSSFNTITTFIFSFFIYYFMLSNSKKIEKKLIHWLPFSEKNFLELQEKFFKILVSNAIGIPMVALAQASVALIGYYMIGLNDMCFWFIVTFFSSAMPILGSSLAYIPITCIFFSEGKIYQGLFVLMWGICIVGSVDNIFRFTLLKKFYNIHPLITVFGIILGLNVFGFLGIIFGPLIISIWFILIDIYKKEYLK